MDGLETWGELAALAIAVGFSTIRLAVAFLVMPLFSNEVMPALVRNSIFAILGFVIVAAVQPYDLLQSVSLGGLALIVAKEVFLGIAIGVLFGIFLWAFEAAGELMDTQTGMSQAQILDPLSGHEVTLLSDFFGRFAHLAFLSLGGLLLLTSIILKSFAIWPIETVLPRLERDGVMVFALTFNDLFTLTLLLAAPALAVIFLIDMGMGLINRFAERLNVFFLSNSIKSFVAVGLVLLMMPLMIQSLLRMLDTNAAETLDMVRSLFG
jgi:type III secretion protein T